MPSLTTTTASAATALLLALALSPTVSAHGYLESLQVNGESYLAWQVGTDNFLDPPPVRYARRLNGNGPVGDFEGEGIICGDGATEPAQGIIELNAGDEVEFIWDQWGSSHSGPVMDYLTPCEGSCLTFHPTPSTPWTKISQLAYNPTASPAWASDLLREQGARWNLIIPPTLTPGEYLLRHEILGLHIAETRGGAQFYPSCTQIRVVEGGGSELPTEGVILPGGYDAGDEAGILVALWRIQQGGTEYVAPGGEVWSEAAPNANRAGP